jgi:hypothetical protein
MPERRQRPKTGYRPNRPASEDYVDASYDRYVQELKKPTTVSAEHETRVHSAMQSLMAYDEAREQVRNAKLRSGGDESRFAFRELRVYDEPEPVELSKGGLLLSHGVHRVNGPAGEGKTRLMYWEVLQRVRAGEAWAIFDTEMGPSRCKQAFAQLGADEHEMRSILYTETTDDIIPDLVAHGRALCGKALAAGCAGILYDSMTSLLAVSGVQENDAQGVRAFSDAACIPMSAAGGTVIVIDHTGHEARNRGRGSSDKSAGCDVDMYLETLQHFAFGQSGAVSLTVNKDRSGTLAVGASLRVQVDCYENGNMEFSPGDWGVINTDEDGNDAVEALGKILRDLGPQRDRDYVTATELRDEMSGQEQRKTEQIKLALRSGEILTEKVGKERHFWFSEE